MYSIYRLTDCHRMYLPQLHDVFLFRLCFSLVQFNGQYWKTLIQFQYARKNLNYRLHTREWKNPNKKTKVMAVWPVAHMSVPAYDPDAFELSILCSFVRCDAIQFDHFVQYHKCCSVFIGTKMRSKRFSGISFYSLYLYWHSLLCRFLPASMAANSHPSRRTILYIQFIEISIVIVSGLIWRLCGIASSSSAAAFFHWFRFCPNGHACIYVVYACYAVYDVFVC